MVRGLNRVIFCPKGILQANLNYNGTSGGALGRFVKLKILSLKLKAQSSDRLAYPPSLSTVNY